LRASWLRLRPVETVCFTDSGCPSIGLSHEPLGERRVVHGDAPPTVRHPYAHFVSPSLKGHWGSSLPCLVYGPHREPRDCEGSSCASKTLRSMSTTTDRRVRTSAENLVGIHAPRSKARRASARLASMARSWVRRRSRASSSSMLALYSLPCTLPSLRAKAQLGGLPPRPWRTGISAAAASGWNRAMQRGL
jgi:hypothetical protein